MEENVLKDYETFSEFPDNYLKVNKNSNYYLIKIRRESFITKKMIDSVEVLEILGVKKLLTQKSYYDVNDGELVFHTRVISNLDGSDKEFIDVEKYIEITPLSSILNISENGVYYLTSEDIEPLVTYKEEGAKEYGLKPRKNYF